MVACKVPLVIVSCICSTSVPADDGFQGTWSTMPKMFWTYPPSFEPTKFSTVCYTTDWYGASTATGQHEQKLSSIYRMDQNFEE